MAGIWSTQDLKQDDEDISYVKRIQALILILLQWMWLTLIRMIIIIIAMYSIIHVTAFHHNYAANHKQRIIIIVTLMHACMNS